MGIASSMQQIMKDNQAEMMVVPLHLAFPHLQKAQLEMQVQMQERWPKFIFVCCVSP